MKHLLPLLLVCLLASCQMHGLGLDEEEVKASTLQELLTAEKLQEEEVKKQMGKSSEALLGHAARRGWLPVVHKLLLKGVPVDSKANNGFPPLHWAAKEGHTEIVRLLLEKGASLDSKDILGYTPLHWAAWQGHTEVAALLLSHGADLTIKDTASRTALQVAQSSYKPQTAAFLELAEGKSKEWLESYSKGFSQRKDHEKDSKKLHTYARVYAELYEEEQDHDLVFTAMPYYFQYLKEGSSHQEAKEGAIMMVHCL